MYSFLILSFLVTSIANLNIFISSTCFFVTTTVSSLYTIAGLTTKLYIFSFTLAGNLLSQIILDTFLHLHHPSCTLFFTSLLQLPLDVGSTTSLPACDPGSTASWGSKRINSRPHSCLCLTWSECPSKR